MADSEHRRRYPRVPSKNSVLVKKLSETDCGVEGFAKTRVVGLGGCMFVSDEQLGSGSFLDLLISVKGTVAKAMAKVVYEIPKEEGSYEVGAEFIHICETDRRLLETLWDGTERECDEDPPMADAP